MKRNQMIGVLVLVIVLASLAVFLDTITDHQNEVATLKVENAAEIAILKAKNAEEFNELEERRELDREMVRMLAHQKLTPEIQAEESYKLVKWWTIAHEKDLVTFLVESVQEADKELEELKQAVQSCQPKDCHSKCEFFRREIV